MHSALDLTADKFPEASRSLFSTQTSPQTNAQPLRAFLTKNLVCLRLRDPGFLRRACLGLSRTAPRASPSLPARPFRRSFRAEFRRLRAPFRWSSRRCGTRACECPPTPAPRQLHAASAAEKRAQMWLAITVEKEIAEQGCPQQGGSSLALCRINCKYRGWNVVRLYSFSDGEKARCPRSI
jgi:hypothetical protein